MWSREQSPRASRALETPPAAREARARGGGGREGRALRLARGFKD